MRHRKLARRHLKEFLLHGIVGGENFVQLLFQLVVIGRTEISFGDDAGDLLEALAGNGIELGIFNPRQGMQPVAPTKAAEEAPRRRLLEEGRIAQLSSELSCLDPLAKLESGAGFEVLTVDPG